MFRRRKRLRLLNEEERRPAEFRVNGYNAGSRKHPPSAAHVEFESHNAASAADSSPGQIAFVMFEIRDDLVLPLQRHRNIILTHISSDRKFDACGHQSRCDKRNTEESRLQHLQPKLNDGVHTTSHLAAGDVHARHSRLQVDDGRARTAMATISVSRKTSSSTLSDSDIGSIPAGETRAESLRDVDWIGGGFGDTSWVAAILANTQVRRRPTITSALDPLSRTDAFAGCRVQLRRHPPRGPRCQPRPQPPAAATTWLVSSAAFIMAAPLAGLANAFDAPSAPTPTATMAAASIARIWLLLFLADTLGRATD